MTGDSIQHGPILRGGQSLTPLADYPEEVFDQVIAVHVRGAFLCCKYGLPAMRDGGNIVITSSVAGVRGDAGVYGYITARHAQVGLIRAVSKEAAQRRIRVNTRAASSPATC